MSESKFSRDFTVLPTHTHTFIHNRNAPYLTLPFQPQLVLIYRPRRDGTLSRPWCEVAQAEIRTCNLPIANPALYHTTTSAHWVCVYMYVYVYGWVSVAEPTMKSLYHYQYLSMPTTYYGVTDLHLHGLHSPSIV